MRHLLACTCLTPVALIVPVAQLHAETVVSTARTTSIATSTANNGAADSVRISSTGSVKIGSGVAVTVDSNHAATNEGTIQITDSNDAVGIQANAGITGAISNTGTITIDETYTPADADKDGDNDGTLAQGARRFGIRTLGGFNGNVSNAGTITVEGNDSAGISLGGTLTGSLTQKGTISVVGDNSFGVRAGAVSGNVSITGTTAAQGTNAIAVALQGDIGGALVIQAAIGSTGYRSITLPSDVSKLDADDLRQGGPALVVSGSVASGILFDAPPRDTSSTDNDEDKDGIEDSKEGTASITSSGAAPAVLVGSAANTSIGAVAGTAAGGHGIVVNGSILGQGVYKDVEGNGVVIGGQGGTVTVAGGMTINGSIAATANNAAATALRLGAGASAPQLKNAGGITSSGGGAAAAVVRAVVVDAGATMNSISNSGKITATAAGDAAAAAIVDRSGALTLVENSGTVSATVAKAGADRAVAIDLSANASGATVKQLVVASGTAAPSIVGSVLFGAGSDLLDLADGTMTGNARFGEGANRFQLSGDATFAGDASFGSGNDTVTLGGTSKASGKFELGAGADNVALSGSASVKGTLDFGGGADSLTLGGTSSFVGTLTNGSGLSIAVSGGTLGLTNNGAVAVAGLSITGQGGIAVNIDAKAGTATQYQVSGAASFAAGSKVLVSLANVSQSEGQYLIVKAGALSGGANLTSTAVAVPFMFKSSVQANDAAGEVRLNIARKSTTELGLNRSQSLAYDAVFKALDADAAVAGSFLSIGDGDTFRDAVKQMLPEHAGGAFETVTQASRATARILADQHAPFSDQGGWGFWLQQVAWGTSKGLGDTSSYDLTGWGFSGGAEAKTQGAGNFGISLAYLAGTDAEGDNDNEVKTTQYEVAAYWRAKFGGFQAHARASAARIGFDGIRQFWGQVGTVAVERRATADWNGTLYGAAAGAAYEFAVSKRFVLRPSVALDYYRLTEKGHTETGGGDAFNLIVDARKSDELAATGSMVAGLDFGGKDPEGGWMRTELEVGRRQIVGGTIGATTAHFKGGQDFVLLPEERTDGWVGALRASGGTKGFMLGGELSAEEQQGRAAIGLRVSLRVGL